MKKSVALVLALVLALAVMIPALVVAEGERIMYVYTQNGKVLNVRQDPTTDSPKIGELKYGEKVEVRLTSASGWATINFPSGMGGVAYVMSRFLSDEQPPKRDAATDEKIAEMETEQKKLNNELKSQKDIDEAFYVVVRATRASGQINFRVGPSKITERVASYPDGKELIVIGETNKWYRARDPETNKVGYIFKDYTVKTGRVASAITTPADGKEKLGKLSVNGEFDLTCTVPEGYKLSVVDMRGTKIIASIKPDDMTRPELSLTVAFDDTYSNVERMNDMSEEDLKILEETFTELDDVEISYSETGHGTKLLIAREGKGDGVVDYVDILAIYKGYFIEFIMTPGEYMANKSLTEEQIQMCIDFLTDVDFVPSGKGDA